MRPGYDGPARSAIADSKSVLARVSLGTVHPPHGGGNVRTTKDFRMLDPIRARLTYANITATLALFIALGGSSYAAIAITGRDVRDHSLTGRDIAAGSVGSTEIRNGSIRGTDIRDGTITGTDLSKPLRRDLLHQ